MAETSLLTSEELSILFLSLKVAFWSMVITVIPGIFCGWILARKAFFGKTLFNSLVHLPLVLPPVVTGYFLLMIFGKQGLFGQQLYSIFGFTFSFNWKGAVLASAIVGFPLLVRSVTVAIELIDSNLERAALTLGAYPLKVFFTITLPLALPGIITGLILCFARSLGEFGATITFVGNIPDETQTIPLAIFTYTQIPGEESGAFRLILISIVISMGALIASEFLNHRARRLLGK